MLPLPRCSSWGRPIRGLRLWFIIIALVITCFSVNLRPLLHPSGTTTAGARSNELFPRKIWQLWTSSPASFKQRDMERVRTWTEQNPEWRWEVVTDANELGYVEYHFGAHRPDVVEFFKSIQVKIARADLLRYLVMYVEGGLYTDIDTSALKPINDFIPKSFNEADIDMVIGVEIDEPGFKDHPLLGHIACNFCQWTFLCKPRLPVMMRLVDSTISRLRNLAEQQGVPISELRPNFQQIIRCSGPGLFTDVIMQHMNDRRTGTRPVTWDDFHDLHKPVLVDGILVLPVQAFAAAQGHSGSGDTHEMPSALVKHHYGASNWTARYSRYSHPVYGEVDKCLFNEDCVNEWDKKVGALETLRGSS